MDAPPLVAFYKFGSSSKKNPKNEHQKLQAVLLLIDKLRESVKMFLLTQTEQHGNFQAQVLMNKSCPNLQLNLLEKIRLTDLGFCALVKYGSVSPVLSPEGKPILYAVIRQNFSLVDCEGEAAESNKNS